MIIDLTDTERKNLESYLRVIDRLKRYRVKENFFDIMSKKYPLEYSEKDKIFFDRYKGKEVFAYCWGGDPDGDWFILEDDNYCLTRECFTLETIKEID